MKYLYPNQIVFIHQKIIELTGGAEGVRDQGLLESAAYRPLASFGGQDLYPTLTIKVAALTHSLSKNHPFVDGNKRTAYEAMRIILQINGFDIDANEEEKFNLMINVAEGKFTEDALAQWIESHLKIATLKKE